MQPGLIYRRYCFNFDTDMLFFNVNIYRKWLTVSKHVSADVFRLCFPHRVMNLRNVKSNRKISCKNSTAQA